MAKYEITAEMNLKTIIAETKEVAQALLDFADRLTEIDEKYSEEDGDRAVSLNAVLEILKKMPNDNPSYWNTCDVINRQDTIDEVLELPSVSQTKTGHWIEHTGWNDDSYGTEYSCDKCNELVKEKSIFCPNCGAEMRGDTDEYNSI